MACLTEMVEQEDLWYLQEVVEAGQEHGQEVEEEGLKRFHCRTILISKYMNKYINLKMSHMQ